MARSDFGFQIGSALATNYLTDSKFIRAGYIAVDTIAERDALPIDTGSGGVIVNGSYCYVKATDKFYLYKDNAWTISENGKVDDIKVGDQSIVVNKVATLTNDNLPTRTLDKISDVTASAAEVNVLDGITATTQELNYSSGVTSNIQTLIDSKSTVSVSQTGTATDKVKYITVDGTEKKLAGGDPDNKTITSNLAELLQAVGLLNQKDSTTSVKEWVGSLLEYKSLSTKDADTIYFTYDDLADLIVEVYGYPLTVAHAIVAEAIDWNLYGNSVQGILPEEYTRLEYIRFDKNNLQYIPITAFNFNNNDNWKFEVRLKLNSLYDYNSIWCSSFDTDTNESWVYSDGSAAYRFKDLKIATTMSLDANTIYDFTYQFKDMKQRFIVSDLFDQEELNTAIRTSDCYLGIGAFNGNDNSDISLYSWKIYENDNLTYNLVPSKDSSGVIGMYDTISSSFFFNKGLGTFIAGPEVKPTPSSPIDVKCCGGGSSILPSEYQEVEYILSTGTLWIDTGITPNQDTSFEAKANLVSGNNFDGIAYVDSATSYAYGFFVFNSKLGVYYNNAYNITSDFIGVDKIYKLDKNLLYIDGNLIYTFAETTFTSYGSLRLFAMRRTTSNMGYAHTKLYYNKIYDDGAIVRDFIPAKRISDNKPGLYDLVSNTFFINAATSGDDFTIGPAVYHTLIPVKVNGTTQFTLAPAEPLRKVDTYADYIDYGTQRISRLVGIKKLDGTENWLKATAWGTNSFYTSRFDGRSTVYVKGFCTHNAWSNKTNPGILSNECIMGGSSFVMSNTDYTSVEDFTAWLVAQKESGTPVTVYYPLTEEVPSSIEIPDISLVRGQNIITVDTEIKPSNMYIKCKVSEAN